ncbi:SRPBCC family protein [Blastococcus sp. SYSU DS0541]
MPEFVFRDEWRVAAPPAAVREVVRAVESWPEWWPSVESVTRVPSGDGEVWRFVFRTRLPYRMEFEARVLRDDPLRGVRTTVTGRVEGEGRWEVGEVDGGSVVAFDWQVRPQLLWMRVLSPLGRPVFVWNHRELMEEGGEALAQRLGTRLLAPTVCEPEVAPAVVAAALWPAALIGMHLLARRRGQATPEPVGPGRTST